MHVSIYIYIERERDVYVYIYIYIYNTITPICMYVCMYIYIYTYRRWGMEIDSFQTGSKINKLVNGSTQQVCQKT